MKVSRNFTGNLSAAAAAALFGVSVVATRVAVQEVSPLNLAVLRYAQGGVLLVLFLSVYARKMLKIDMRDLPFLVLLGAVFFAAFPLTFNIGMRYTEASRGAIMLATMPIWSAVLARATGRERLNFRQILGIAAVFSGVGIVLSKNGLNLHVSGSALLGDGLLLFTALLGAIYGVLAKRVLGRYSAITVTAYAMIFGTLLLFPASVIEGFSLSFIHSDSHIVALVLFLGVFGGAVGFYLWTFALAHLSPTQVAVYTNVNPVTAIILGIVLLGESVSGSFVIGVGILFSGVLLVNWPVRNSQQQ